MEEIDIVEDLLDGEVLEVPMVTYAVIDSQGDILRIGECEEGQHTLQAESGQTVLLNPPSNVTDESHYYKNGAYKPYPTKPGSYSVFNYTTETWTDTRSADRNLDFDLADYTIEPTWTVSGNTVTLAAFTAVRDNGVYSESKARSAATVTYVDKPLFVSYLWDSNSYGAYSDYKTAVSSSRRFLIGELRGPDEFIPSNVLTDGSRVAANSINSRQVAPFAITETELALLAVGEKHLQMDSVTASKIGITDMTNVVPDSEMKDDAAWIRSAPDTKWSRGNNPANTFFKTAGFIKYNATGLTSGYSNYMASKRFTVDPDREYLFKYQTHSHTGSTHGVWGRIHWFDAAGSETGSYTTIGADTQRAAGVYESRNKVTPPAAAKSAEIRFYVNHSRTSGEVNISSMFGRIMANGELIVDGTITSIHLQSRSVLTSHLVVTDFTNLVPNNTLETNDSWRWDSTVSYTNSTPSNTTAKGNLVFAADTSTNRYAYAGYAPNDLIPIDEEEEYYIEGWFRASSTAPYATPLLATWWYDGSGNYMGSSSSTGSARTNTGYGKHSWSVKFPTGARYARFGFGRRATANEKESMYFERPMVRRKNGGNLLVEGSIESFHLTSDSIDTRHLKAGVITASKLSVMDMTNLVPDSEFQDVVSWWGIPNDGLGVLQLRPTGSFGSAKTEGDVIYWNSRNAANANVEFRSGFIPVSQGDVLYLGGQLMRSGGTKMRAFIGYILYDKSRNSIDGSFQSPISVNGTASTTAMRSTEVTIPSGAYFIRWRGYVYGADTDSNVVFASPTVRFKNKGEMIVDGSLTSRHFNTETMNVEGLALFGGTLQSKNFSQSAGRGWKIDANTDTLYIPNAIIKSAHIDDLQVGTEKIANNAATVMERSYTSGDVTVGGSNTVVQTLAYTIGRNGPQSIDAFFEFAGAPDRWRVQIQRIVNGSGSWVAEFVYTNSAQSGVFNERITDPDNRSGNITYRIFVVALTAQATLLVSKRYLGVLNALK